MTLPKIIGTFVRGEIIKEEIIVLEVWSLKNIAEEFEKRKFLTRQ